MRTVHFRLVIVAAALLAFAGTGTAQDDPNSLLNTLEVRQLAARAEPGDSARLSAHFSALADRYTAEAKRHLSMSQSFVGNPNRDLGTGMSVHCKRLADLNTQAAATLLDLATYHADLAKGKDATPPAGAGRYHSGAGAPAPTDKQLAELAAKASTPADHRGLEEYFRTLAARYDTDAKAHASFAAGVRGTRIEHAATSHDRLATLSRDAAREARAAADMHKQLATIAR